MIDKQSDHNHNRPDLDSRPDLPSGHDRQSLLLLLESHGWDTRTCARALGIPYRRLTALRRIYSLRAPARRATPPSPAQAKREPLESPLPEFPRLPLPPRALVDSAGKLIPLNQWGQLNGRTSGALRELRQNGSLEPLFVFGQPPQISYYTTAQARVLPPTQRQPAIPLEGYVALHELQREHGALLDLARSLSDRGELRLIGHRPTLLSDEDAKHLLAHFRESQSTAPPLDDAPPLEISAAPRSVQLDSPPTPASSAPIWSEPYPDKSDSDVIFKPAAGPGLPYVAQYAYLRVPRFEATWQGDEFVISDRGAGGEHWHKPQPQARFLNATLAKTIFPVLHILPAPSTPLDPPLREATEPESPEPDPVPHEVQLDEGLSSAPEDVPTAPEDSPEDSLEDSPEDSLEGELRAELEQTRARFEHAQAQLAQTQKELDARRAILPQQDPSRGQRRVPDRQMRQREEALRASEEALRASEQRVKRLEGELHGALADVAALAHPQSRVKHLIHVRERLQERFGLEYSEEQVEALDRQVVGLSSIGVTKNGSMFKRVRVGEQTLYPLIVRDEGGAQCLGTVYTVDMYKQNQARQIRARSRKPPPQP